MDNVKVELSRIVQFLGISEISTSFVLEVVASADNPRRASLIFARRLKSSQIEKIATCTPVCAIVETLVDEVDGLIQIPVQNARLSYIRILQKFFLPIKKRSISSTASIDETARIGNNVFIGDYVVVGSNSIIEDDCEVLPHVVIGDNVICKKGVRIKSGSIVGQKGFGFERDDDGIPIEFPHLGGVIIDEYCEIGALNTIVSGTIEPTYIGKYVKTDDHVHIAHNVVIGEKTLIAACAEISGSVSVGSRVWISPNSTIINKVNIGSQSFVGLGAVVTKNVPERQVFAGNPAIFIREVRLGKDPV
jgi:UDP-3-O-[3-hydroxymyristoyl] glucosamine N-acyltransferase LpxD